MALPPLAIRGDWGVLSTEGARYAPSLLKSFIQMGPQGALGATKLIRPFSEIIDSLELKNTFIRNWVDLLCFLLAGVKSNATLSAEMNIPEDLGIHHIVVNDWTRGVDADQNFVLISIPSVLSKNLAPPGKHVLHAYTLGTEPFGLWEGLDRRSSEYKRLKAEPSEVMWKAVERVLGSGFSREDYEVKLVGTPLTHQRFLRRNRGTYGPAIKAGEATFPGHSTPIAQLFCCGDSTFPGFGVPAVAASGAIVANSLVSVSEHSQLLDGIGI